MRSTVAVTASAAALAAAPALAAGAEKGTPSEVVFLAQIVVLVLLGRLMGEAMQRIGQPAVMGQLLAGLLLGPSVLGALWPQAQRTIFPADPAQKGMIDAVSQLGILMLLLLAGMETDLSLVRKVRRAALSASLAGVVVPFICGFVLGEFLPEAMLPRPDQRLITALFLGTALSIASVKIVAVVVREMNFLRRDIGQVIVASAIIDDTIGWIIIAITFGLTQHGRLEWGALAWSVLGTALFLGISFTLGRRAVSFLIRWTNDAFVSEAAVISTILVVMGLMALTTHAIGVHTVLGAFVAGILVGESPILTRQIDERLRSLITALFMPVFFGVAGLGADLTILADLHLLLLTLGLVLIASVGKFGGAFLGARSGGLTLREALALGCGMNARGSTEVIIASIGLGMGILSRDLYTMIVTMAFVTTMAMPPSLRWALGRLPVSAEEQARLEREALEARGFVPNLERLLVAADASPVGRFASRLAGLLAASRGMPVTVLHLADTGASAEPTDPAETSGATAVVEAAAGAHGPEQEPRTPSPVGVEVLARPQEGSVRDTVHREARKGYDLLLIGIARTVGPDGGFHEDVAHIAAGFEGALAVATARGVHVDRPLDTPLSILIPVSGALESRRGAEVGLALARAASAPATALHVVATGARQTPWRRRRARQREREAALKSVIALADRYEVPIRTVVRTDVAVEDAILQQAKQGRHNLIVMGVRRRAGETLSFGDVAAEILERAACSILFVAS
ncbi:cation:proton antiporter [Benzoatithermus flavus]|uniref:Cation:proton antiporter n=1 Tax=Benzoatithermus flavus TaxID=3108223 RepID=A0ABU8XXA4_9PROT